MCPKVHASFFVRERQTAVMVPATDEVGSRPRSPVYRAALLEPSRLRDNGAPLLALATAGQASKSHYLVARCSSRDNISPMLFLSRGFKESAHQCRYLRNSRTVRIIFP